MFEHDDDTATNESKGCGGVMRAAPCGLVTGWGRCAIRLGDLPPRWTHGHPTGYPSAGALATIIADLKDGGSLELAVDTAIEAVDGEVHARYEGPRPSKNGRPTRAR